MHQRQHGAARVAVINIIAAITRISARRYDLEVWLSRSIWIGHDGIIVEHSKQSGRRLARFTAAPAPDKKKKKRLNSYLARTRDNVCKQWRITRIACAKSDRAIK